MCVRMQRSVCRHHILWSACFGSHIPTKPALRLHYHVHSRQPKAATTASRSVDGACGHSQCHLLCHFQIVNALLTHEHIPRFQIAAASSLKSIPVLVVALVSLLHAAQGWCVQALDSECNTVDDSGNFTLCGQTIVVHDPSQKVRTLTNPQAASSVSQSESEGQTQPHTRATHTTKTNAGHAKQDSYALSYDTPSARRYAPRPGRPA